MATAQFSSPSTRVWLEIDNFSTVSHSANTGRFGEYDRAQSETGVAGVQGQTGVQGIQGETGAGIQGVTGVQGIQEIIGVSSFSKTGTFYNSPGITDATHNIIS